jgi:tetratricopeptide (TPR) repeat protein
VEPDAETNPPRRDDLVRELPVADVVEEVSVAETAAVVEKGLELLPNDPDAHIFVAVINGMRGNSKESIAAAEAAYRISPNFANGPYLNVISHANFMAGNYKASLAAHEKNVQRGGPVGPPALCWAAASYFLEGELTASEEAAKRLKSDFPDFRLTGWNFLQLVEDEDVRKRLESAFLQAGIPS